MSSPLGENIQSYLVPNFVLFWLISGLDRLIQYLFRAIFDVHRINCLHKVIVDFQGLLVRTKLLGIHKNDKRLEYLQINTGHLELLGNWQGELEERSAGDASLCRLWTKSGYQESCQQYSEWYLSVWLHPSTIIPY